MNNYHPRYMEAIKKLHGTGKHVCQHPGCKTMCLGKYCFKHIETGQTVIPSSHQPERK